MQDERQQEKPVTSATSAKEVTKDGVSSVRCGHVLFCSDDRGFLPLTVALYSLLKSANPSRALRVSIFTGGEEALSPEHVARLRAVAEGYPFVALEVVDVSWLLARWHDAFFNPKSAWCMLMWARCFIGEIFREEKGNIVYLDIDTFVTDALDDLYDLDLGGNALAGVYESSRQEDQTRCASFWNCGLIDDSAERYFNSGVLVLNVEYFREEHVLEKLATWFVQNREKVFRDDQDALNALFWNRILPLPPAFNYTDGWCHRQLKHSVRQKWWRGNPPREILEAILNPRIIHYWSKSKPWKCNHRPERRRYERAMRELRFLPKGQTLPGTTFSRRLEVSFFDVWNAILRLIARIRLWNLTRHV